MKSFFIALVVSYAAGMTVATIYRVRTGHWYIYS